MTAQIIERRVVAGVERQVAVLEVAHQQAAAVRGAGAMRSLRR